MGRGMSKKKKPSEATTLTDQLREVIRNRQREGLSLNQLAKDADLDSARLSRFMTGKRGLSIDALDALWDALHLRITTDANPDA